PKLLAQHRPFARIHPMQHENTLGRVHSNPDNLVHGRLPRLRSSTTSSWHTDAVGGRPPQQRRCCWVSRELDPTYASPATRYRMRGASCACDSDAAVRTYGDAAPSYSAGTEQIIRANNARFFPI